MPVDADVREGGQGCSSLTPQFTFDCSSSWALGSLIANEIYTGKTRIKTITES